MQVLIQWQTLAVMLEELNANLVRSFPPITSIDGLNPETSNHALRCRMLSGSMMASSIPVILHILQSSMALCSSSVCACGP